MKTWYDVIEAPKAHFPENFFLLINMKMFAYVEQS